MAQREDGHGEKIVSCAVWPLVTSFLLFCWWINSSSLFVMCCHVFYHVTLHNLSCLVCFFFPRAATGRVHRCQWGRERGDEAVEPARHEEWVGVVEQDFDIPEVLSLIKFFHVFLFNNLIAKTLKSISKLINIATQLSWPQRDSELHTHFLALLLVDIIPECWWIIVNCTMLCNPFLFKVTSILMYNLMNTFQKFQLPNFLWSERWLSTD